MIKDYNNPSSKYLIYCPKRDMFWNRSRQGYTNFVSSIGIFPYKMAMSITSEPHCDDKAIEINDSVEATVAYCLGLELARYRFIQEQLDSIDDVKYREDLKEFLSSRIKTITDEELMREIRGYK